MTNVITLTSPRAGFHVQFSALSFATRFQFFGPIGQQHDGSNAIAGAVFEPSNLGG